MWATEKIVAKEGGPEGGPPPGRPVFLHAPRWPRGRPEGVDLSLAGRVYMPRGRRPLGKKPGDRAPPPRFQNKKPPPGCSPTLAECRPKNMVIFLPLGAGGGGGVGGIAYDPTQENIEPKSWGGRGTPPYQQKKPARGPAVQPFPETAPAPRISCPRRSN